MKTLIIEDEPHSASKLVEMLTKLKPGSTIVGIIPSVTEAVQYFNSHVMPDLILMDINLSDGSCFSIFEITKVTAPIIFCTAYDEFALKAFQTTGIAYLLKPVIESDLQLALQKIDQLKKLPQNYKTIAVEKYKSRFLIQAGEKIFPVFTKDIACFNKEQHGLKLHLKRGESYFIDYTVTELNELLKPREFFRVSRQTIVAKDAILTAKVRVRDASVTIKGNNTELPISRERAKTFRKWFGN